MEKPRQDAHNLSLRIRIGKARGWCLRADTKIIMCLPCPHTKGMNIGICPCTDILNSAGEARFHLCPWLVSQSYYSQCCHSLGFLLRSWVFNPTLGYGFFQEDLVFYNFTWDFHFYTVATLIIARLKRNKFCEQITHTK